MSSPEMSPYTRPLDLSVSERYGVLFVCFH